MPTHIIIIGNVSNFVIFSAPIVVSIVMYVILTREVQRKKTESGPEVLSIRTAHSADSQGRERNSSTNHSSDVGPFDDILPYPLNAVQESVGPNQVQGRIDQNRSTIIDTSALSMAEHGQSLKARIKNLMG
jgi:hypothetical protein